MSNEEMVAYIQDWFPPGDPHFEDLTNCFEEPRHVLEYVTGDNDFLDFIAGGKK